MKSDVIIVKNDGQGTDEALKQPELIAAYKGLSQRDTLHLRLLAEEMISMLRALTGEVSAKFWMEDKDNVYQLHLCTETLMNAEKRENLLHVATSGKNEAAKGFMNKIRDLFEQSIEPETDGLPPYFVTGWGYTGMTDAGMDLMLTNDWSFNKYKDSLDESNPEDQEKWDELEKSIVANLADEVKIFIKDNTVEMVIYKKIG